MKLDEEKKGELISNGDFMDSRSTRKINVESEGQLKVYCRLKPTSESLESRNIMILDLRLQWNTTEVKAVTSNMIKHYKFTHVFDQFCNQKETFRTMLSKPIKDCIERGISSIIKAKNLLLFTYGVSGSGKTHSMIGQQLDGLFPATIRTLLHAKDFLGNSQFFSDQENNSRSNVWLSLRDLSKLLLK